MRAIALTDHANMYGAIRHYNAARAQGLTPILGCEVNVVRKDASAAFDHLVLLAATKEGYKNLIGLVSEGHLRSASPHGSAITTTQIAENSKGIIALSGCLGGVAAQRILEYGPDSGEAILGELRDMFEPGHVFVELQDHGFPEQGVVNDTLVKAAARLNLPLVASNDVHFMNKEDGQAQIYLECVRQGRTFAEAEPLHHGSFEMYLKSQEEMISTFSALPQAIDNTLLVTEMCSGLKLNLGQPMLPHFKVPEGYDLDGYFRHVSKLGLERRLSEFQVLGKVVDVDAYHQRLQRELDVIVNMKYPGYFLIVWDFIREAKARGIPVGPGRGSGAGSVVAYSLGITDLDPLQYALLFERFLNPESVSMPDFDIDFCQEGRDRVIDYVKHKYGLDAVSQIATFGTMAAKAVFRDVGRVLDLPFNFVDGIAKLIPMELGITLSDALVKEPQMAERRANEEEVHELLELALRLEGLVRNVGMHAGGVLISPGKISDFSPIYCQQDGGSLVSQYDKDDVEAVGLVKFDFLGLRTLTILELALVNANKQRAALGEAPLSF